MSEINEIIREFLHGLLPNSAALRDDTSLLTSGVIDSMILLQLVGFLEETFGIQVEANEATRESFDRIDNIAAFVERKRKQLLRGNAAEI